MITLTNVVTSCLTCIYRCFVQLIENIIVEVCVTVQMASQSPDLPFKLSWLCMDPLKFTPKLRSHTYTHYPGRKWIHTLYTLTFEDFTYLQRSWRIIETYVYLFWMHLPLWPINQTAWDFFETDFENTAKGFFCVCIQHFIR